MAVASARFLILPFDNLKKIVMSTERKFGSIADKEIFVSQSFGYLAL